MAKETPEEFRARIGNGPAISGSALPTRSPESQGHWDRMKKWDKEHDAFKTLAKAGRAGEVDNLSQAPARVKALGG